MFWDGRWCGGSERLAGPGLFWGMPLHFAFILALSRLVFCLRFTTFLVSWRAWLVRGHLASLPQRFPESLLAVGAACDPACTKKGARATQVGGCATRCGEREKYATAPAACSCTHSAQPEHLVGARKYVKRWDMNVLTLCVFSGTLLNILKFNIRSKWILYVYRWEECASYIKHNCILFLAYARKNTNTKTPG